MYLKLSDGEKTGIQQAGIVISSCSMFFAFLGALFFAKNLPKFAIFTVFPALTSRSTAEKMSSVMFFASLYGIPYRFEISPMIFDCGTFVFPPPYLMILLTPRLNALRNHAGA